MSRFAKAALILMLAAIPLRGMAGVIAAFCDSQHHGAGQITHAEFVGAEHEATSHGEAGDGLDAKCSHCSACSVNSPLVSGPAHGIADAGSGALPISFLQRSVPGRLPAQLDRPPLVL